MLRKIALIAALLVAPLLVQAAPPHAPGYTIVDLGVIHISAYQTYHSVNDRNQMVGTGPTYGVLWYKGTEISIAPLPGDTASGAGMINNKSQVTGNSWDGYNGHSFFWDKGEVSEIDGIYTDLNSSICDLNDRGQVVGTSSIVPTSSPEHTFVWQDGKYTNIGVPIKYGTCAINIRGQVAAESSLTGKAFIWDRGKITNLGSLSVSKYSLPYDISNSGLVIGTSFDDSFTNSHAVIWRSGKILDIGTSSSYGYALKVNHKDQVIGEIGTAGFFWSSGVTSAITDTGTWGVPYIQVIDLNDSGQVVGESSVGPFVWYKGTITYLNQFIPKGKGWGFANPLRIYNSGQIFILGYNTVDNTNHVFLAKPVEGNHD